MVERLAEHAQISSQASAAILQLPYVVKNLQPGSYFVREGAPTDEIGVLISGIAVCQKISGEGDRQIVSIQIPSDILGLQNLYLDTSDHNVQTLTQCLIVSLPKKSVKAVATEHAAVRQAIILTMLTEASMLRELLLNIGRRDARARVAHFLCQYAVRIFGIDRMSNRTFELPMTQEQLGDTLGLTAVHINRMLKSLCKENLIARDGKAIRFVNWDALRDVADFNTRHLHLKRPDLSA